MTTTPGDVEGSLVDNLRKQIDDELRRLIAENDTDVLHESARYVLGGGGKRLRPTLVLLSAAMYGVPTHVAMPGALAVEVFHNFTLVHDDIMDRSGERRGRPTVHARWNDAVAILAGDYLMSLAYTLLARLEVDDLRGITVAFGAMVRSLCEGQLLDMAFEERNDVTVGQYRSMIDGKTAALLRASLVLGGQIGGAPESDLALLESAGTELGLAFQIQDDLLDIVADDSRWGKPVGGDLIQGKKTYLVLRAVELERATAEHWFADVMTSGGLDPAKVVEARSRLERLGVLSEAEQVVRLRTDAALETLRRLPASNARAVLLSCWNELDPGFIDVSGIGNARENIWPGAALPPDLYQQHELLEWSSGK